MRQREVVGAERDSVPEDHERSGAVEVHAEQPVAVAIHHDAAEELGERVGAHEVGGGVLDSQHAGDGLLAQPGHLCSEVAAAARGSVLSRQAQSTLVVAVQDGCAGGKGAEIVHDAAHGDDLTHAGVHARISAWHVEVAVVVWRREYQVIGALAGLV